MNIFKEYGKYIGGALVIYVFVFLSVLFSGFPQWEFPGPINYDPNSHPYVTCLAITGIVFFITILLFDDLGTKKFLGTASLNGFAYNSTIMNWVMKGTGGEHSGVLKDNVVYLLAASEQSVLRESSFVDSVLGVGATLLISIIFFILAIVVIQLKRKKRTELDKKIREIEVELAKRLSKSADETEKDVDKMDRILNEAARILVKWET